MACSRFFVAIVNARKSLNLQSNQSPEEMRPYQKRSDALIEIGSSLGQRFRMQFSGGRDDFGQRNPSFRGMRLQIRVQNSEADPKQSVGTRAKDDELFAVEMKRQDLYFQERPGAQVVIEHSRASWDLGFHANLKGTVIS